MDMPSKKKKIIFVLMVLVLLGIICIAIYVLLNADLVTTDDAYIEGRIHSIAARVPGTVKEVYAVDNKKVKKQELLLEIRPDDYDLQVSAAKAVLEAEKVKYSSAQTGIRTAQISLDQAVLDKQRAQELFKGNVIPKEKYEKINTAYALAVEALKAAKENEELEGALVAQRESAYKAAQLNLSYTKITSPSDGYVTKKSVESGNQVQPGQPLMAVVALDDVWIVANYKETQLKNVRPGQKVKIRVDTYKGKVFNGKVDSIMVGTGSAFSLFPQENALGNYVKVVQRVPVKIVFDKEQDGESILRIGMSCVPSIIAKND